MINTLIHNWRTFKLLDRLNYESTVKMEEGWGVGVHSLARNTSRVKGRAGAPKWGLKQKTIKSIIHTNLHKSNNKLVSA